MEFVNRAAELEALRHRLSDRLPVLIRVYGRRRIGKSALLQELTARERGLFLVVEETGLKSQLASLAKQIAEHARVEPRAYRDWPDLLEHLEEIKPRFLVLDEFQYALAARRGVASVLQRFWDQRLQRSGPSIILCGSSIGMMQRMTSLKPAPLFGRLAADLRLQPFRYGDVRLLYPDLSEEERVRRYSVFGGTPFYHLRSVGRDLEAAVSDSFLAPDAPLAREPQSLLRAELRDPLHYNAILREIAHGARDLATLEDRLGMRQGTVSPYLQVLRDDMDLIRSEEPVCGRRRRTRYVFSDPFFEAYYRFIHGNLDRLERREADAVWRDMERGLDAFVGHAAEDVARQALIALNGRTWRGRTVEFHQIGRWWNRRGDEIDIVARGPAYVLACEVKWTRDPAGVDVYRELERKTALIEGRGRLPVRLGLISKAGFTKDAKKEVERFGGLLLDLEDMARVFDGH